MCAVESDVNMDPEEAESPAPATNGLDTETTSLDNYDTHTDTHQSPASPPVDGGDDGGNVEPHDNEDGSSQEEQSDDADCQPSASKKAKIEPLGEDDGGLQWHHGPTSVAVDTAHQVQMEGNTWVRFIKLNII